jgi:membrane-associated phospholipid phosphatase
MLEARFHRSPRRRSFILSFRRSRAAVLAPFLAAAATVGVASVAGADQELSRVSAAALSLELGGAVLLMGVGLALPSPESCSWCNPPLFDEQLALPAAPENRRIAGRMSHVFSYAVIPALMASAVLVPPFTTSGSEVQAYQNLAIVSEVVLVDLALTLAVKKWIARRRPAFFYRRTAYTEYALDSREANVSFFSGDTSAAFAAVSAAATVSFMRGYRSAPYVTVAGAAFAGATGLLRSAADVHWPSDVITGALVGTGLGVALPLLLHPHRKVSTEPSMSEGAPLRTLASDAPAIQFSGRF